MLRLLSETVSKLHFIMPRCCVLSCGRRRDEDNPRLTFHSLPKNASLRQKWIDVIGSRNINLNVKNIIICSLHFEESCINKTMNAIRLQDNAVPSLHLQVTEELFKNINRKDKEEIKLITLKKTLKIDKYDLDIKHTDLCEDVQTEYKKEIKSENESEEDSDEEITIIINDNVSDLDGKNIEEISDVDSEISDTLSDLVNENNYFNDDASDSSETDNVDFDKEHNLRLFVKKECVIKPTHNPNQKLVLDEKLFTISNLSYEEQLLELEKRKEKKIYQLSLFKCTICYTGFIKQQTYDSHMLRHTDASGKYECRVCKMHFTSNHRLISHKSRNHKEVITCNECGYVTKLRKAAQRHEEWHKGKKYFCPHCKEEFVKYSSYKGHLRIQHPSKHICQLCGYTFIGEKGLEVHKRVAHKEDNLVVPEDGPVCEPCNVMFATEEAYQKHLSISHAINGKKARNDRYLSYKSCNTSRVVKVRDENVVVQKVKWPIPCEQCGILLADSHAYNGHFRKMHPDKNRTQFHGKKTPLMCDACGRMFQSSTLLGAHRLTHTDVRNFKCDYCGKEFFTKMRLVAHLRTHDANRRRYCCVVCGKQFSSPSNRQKHMLLHSGQKPYKCELCDKSFYLPSDKKTHIKYAHMKVPWPRKKKDVNNGRKHQAQSLTMPSEQEINKDNEPSVQDGYEHNGVKRRKTRADNESSGQEICENVEEQLICDNMKSEQVIDKDIKLEQVEYEDIESEQIYEYFEMNEEEICDVNMILIVKNE